MKILSIKRTNSAVTIRHEVKGPVVKYLDKGVEHQHQGIEERRTIAHEIPLESFDKAFQALRSVAANILEVGADYSEGMVVHTMSLSYTKNGTRSVAIGFTKRLSVNGGDHSLDTPFFQIDDAVEDGRRECTAKQADHIEKVIEETVRYANGERQQMQLGGELSDCQEEPADGEELPFGDDDGQTDASLFTKDGVCVASGQVWEARDRRMRGKRVTIHAAGNGVASYLDDKGRERILRVNRMHKHSSGWTLVPINQEQAAAK